jgi:hypothetical protein
LASALLFADASECCENSVSDEANHGLTEENNAIIQSVFCCGRGGINERGGAIMSFNHVAGAAALGVAMLVGAGLSAPSGRAAYIVTLAQVASNVVATGSGTIDLTGLSSEGASTKIILDQAFITTAPAGVGQYDAYTGFTGPASFGPGGQTLASSGRGDFVGLDDVDNFLLVLSGYVSGSVLSDSSTYADQTFSGLGVTPGVYTWTWGSTAADDSFSLIIEVPEPASVVLLAAPLGLVMLFTARYRRATGECLSAV